MNEQAIKKRISDSMKQVTPIDHKKLDKLRQGQVRLLKSTDTNRDSRYVLILNSNPIQETATVALISNLTNLATERDYISKRVEAKSQFDLAILLDFQAIANFEQMQESRLFGEICSLCCKFLFSNSVYESNHPVKFPQDHDCLSSGNFPIQLGDTVWNMRNLEFEALEALCSNSDSTQMAIREAKNLSQINSLEEFMAQSSDFFNRENILQLQDSSLDLIRC
jgi:hypothetical protein